MALPLDSRFLWFFLPTWSYTAEQAAALASSSHRVQELVRVQGDLITFPFLPDV